MERLPADSADIASDSKPDDRGPIISRGESQGDSPPGRVLVSSARYICFGPFRVDQRRQELSRDGSRVRLQGKVYQALLTDRKSTRLNSCHLVISYAVFC